MSKYKKAWKQMRSIVFEEPDNDYANDLVRQIVYRKLLRLKMIKYENGEFIWDKLEKSDTSKENCTIEQHEEIHYLRDKLKQTQKECDEWKARAEILERALRIEIRKSINQYRSDMAFDTGEFNMPWSQPCFVDNDSKEVEDTIQSLLQQAEKEIEEERK